MADTQSPFLRALASSSRPRRVAALSALRTYLSSRPTFTELDLLKIQKALFYTLYMQDKPKLQQRLSIELSELCYVFKSDKAGRENFLEWTGCFWEIMKREWDALDKYRMDKFLFLMRRYVHAGFEVLSRTGWDEGFVASYLQVMAKVPFNAREVKVSVGLKLHVVDVWVDELEKVDAERKAPADVLLAPLRGMGKDSPAKNVRTRVLEALADERLEEWGVKMKTKTQVDDEAEDDEEDEEFGGFDD